MALKKISVFFFSLSVSKCLEEFSTCYCSKEEGRYVICRIEKNYIFIQFFLAVMFYLLFSKIVMSSFYKALIQARSGGGDRYPCAPLDMHPQEPEAGSDLLNSKLTYIIRFFTFLINRQCHNLSIFISQILSCTLAFFLVHW